MSDREEQFIRDARNPALPKPTAQLSALLAIYEVLHDMRELASATYMDSHVNLQSPDIESLKQGDMSKYRMYEDDPNA